MATNTRVTVEEFKTTFDHSLSDGAIEAWIDSAHLDVNDIAEQDPSISDDRLREIELRLAQAKAVNQDPRVESMSFETGSISYEDSEMDYWGLAVAADPTGSLSGYGKPKAGLSVPDSKGIE